MYFDSYATGKRIQQLRKANGMTQEQFAIELNTSDRHIRRIERGEKRHQLTFMLKWWQLSILHLIICYWERLHRSVKNN